MYIVTGANGFIGSVLVRELNTANRHNVICTDHVSPEERPGPLCHARFVEFVPADELISKLKGGGLLDQTKAVFHMGACSSTSETDVEYLKKNNTEYTQQLFELCTEFQVPFIYASSASVYGDGKKGFDDTTPPSELTPMHPYGWSKLKFDQWALEQTQTPPGWYGLRFFNVYGPNEYHKQEMCSVAYKAFLQILQSGSLKLFRSHDPGYEDGKQMRDFVYVKDVVRWMLELADKPDIKPGVYNMGFGQARTWLDLAKAVFASMGKELKIDWIDIPEHLRHQYQYYTCADNSRLHKQGLTAPQWSLEAGVSDYVKEYLLKSDPHL